MVNQVPSNLDVERHCLSCLIRYPSIFPDIIPLVTIKDFYNEIHESLFAIIVSVFHENKTINKVLVASRAANINLRIENIPLVDYVDAICNLSEITEEKALDYFRELKKYSIARSIYLGAEEVKKTIKQKINEPAKVFVAETEKIFQKCITSYVSDDKPVDLHEGIREMIESIGENPTEDGIIPPFKQFYQRYGGLTIGDFTVIAAPPKAGKSTILANIVIESALNPKNKCKVLMLDTELETDRVRRRRLAQLSGVNEFYLRTGKWRLNKTMISKVRTALDKLEKAKGKVDHIYVANKPIDEILSISRRWRATQVKDDEIPLICYDYLKLTGEKTSDHWKEYQVIGQKTDSLKHLFSELGAAGIGAVQTNAMGDIAMAQQIKWFASNIYIIRPKTPEEIADHGQGMGTHILSAIATRNQGEDASGFDQLVQITDSNGNTTLVENYLCYDFNNFGVKEIGSLKQIMDHHHNGISLDSEEEDGSILID